MGLIAFVSGRILRQTWLVLSLLCVVVTSMQVRHEGVVALRRPCGSPDISWHHCVVKKGCSWEDDIDVIRKGQSRCYRSVRRFSSNAPSRLRTMCMSSGAWRTDSESGARTVPCYRPNAASQERHDWRMTSKDDRNAFYEEVVIEELITQTRRKKGTKPSAPKPAKSRASGWEEFIVDSAISPEEELGSDEAQSSESSEVAMESEPGIGIESSLALESQTEALSSLDELTEISSLTSLEAEAISSEDGEEALPSEYSEEAISSDYGEEDFPSEYAEESLASGYGEEALPSEYAEEAISSGYGEEGFPSEYAEEAVASVSAEESVESPSPSFPSLGRIDIAEDEDLEEYKALETFLEAFHSVDTTLTSPTTSTELQSELTRKPVMPSYSELAGDTVEDSIPSSPSLLNKTQESMTSQTADEDTDAPRCTIAPVASLGNKEDPIIILGESFAPSPTTKEEDRDLVDEATTSIAEPSSGEASDEVPIPSPSLSSAKMESVAPKLSVITEGIGYIEDPLLDTSIEKKPVEIKEERFEYPFRMQGYGTLPDTELCSIQDARSPPHNVPCLTKPPQPSSAETEPCGETEEIDVDIGKGMEGYAYILHSIEEKGTETQLDTTQEPAPASEPAPAKQIFCYRTVRPHTSETEKLPKVAKPATNPPAQKGTKSHKTKKTPHFPKSSPSATSAEAGSRRSTGPTVTYPEHKSPVYPSRQRLGQQHRPSDVMTHATSGTKGAGMSHLDRAWARKDYSKPIETRSGHIFYSKDKAQQYGRWKPAETDFTTHQPERFRAETASDNNCIVYRRIPCGKKNINEKACRARGCCWLKISNHYWKRGCYQPRS